MADRNPKPEGMQWLNIYIVVSDPHAALNFYSNAFGFKERMKLQNDDGVVEHAEMTYKDCPIMMGPESTAENRRTPKSAGSVPAGFYLYVDDVDALYERAKSAGATVTEELNDNFWGDRTCGFVDPDGHQWTFAQNVRDMDPNDIPG